MLTVFIQRMNGTPKTDDVIHISTTDGISFTFLYIDRESYIRQSFKTDKRNIMNYFYNLFDLITMDDEPFHSIQFNLPTYPIVLFNINRLNTTKINNFMKILEDSIENFPVDNSIMVHCESRHSS